MWRHLWAFPWTSCSSFYAGFTLLSCWFLLCSFFSVLCSLFFLQCSLFFVLSSVFFVLVSCCFLSSFFMVVPLGFEPRTSEVWSQNAVTELWRLLYIEWSKFPYISFIHNNDVMLVSCWITACFSDQNQAFKPALNQLLKNMCGAIYEHFTETIGLLVQCLFRACFMLVKISNNSLS